MAKAVLLALTLCVASGIAFLALSRVPAPTRVVEKNIPTEGFFQ